MKYFHFITLCVLQFWFSVQSTSAQQIHFYPVSDTVLTIDGCTGPEIICSISQGPYSDSIIILPGFNTRLEYVDSMGQNHPIDKCYFLVDDSLHQFDYELWYYPRGVLPYFQQIPFDSAFITWDEYYDIKLIATLQGVHVDSLYQFFKSVAGLSIGENYHHNISDEILLYPTYPNPFNVITAINFFLRKKSKIELKIYNNIGQVISTILNEEKLPGNYLIEWNAGDLSSGIYYIYLSGERGRTVQRCLLLK